MDMKYKIGIVEYDLNELIDKWVAKEFREEAKEIVFKYLDWNDFGSHYMIVELIIYHERDMGNIFCLHLDKMKLDLVKQNIMEKGGNFGNHLEMGD